LDSPGIEVVSRNGSAIVFRDISPTNAHIVVRDGIAVPAELTGQVAQWPDGLEVAEVAVVCEFEQFQRGDALVMHERQSMGHVRDVAIDSANRIFREYDGEGKLVRTEKDIATLPAPDFDARFGSLTSIKLFAWERSECDVEGESPERMVRLRTKRGHSLAEESEGAPILREMFSMVPGTSGYRRLYLGKQSFSGLVFPTSTRFETLDGAGKPTFYTLIEDIRIEEIEESAWQAEAVRVGLEKLAP